MFYGWWIVFACAAIIVLAGGPFFYGFSVFVDPLVQDFGWSTLATAAAFSLRSEVSAIAAPVAGVLVDRFGSRRVIIGGVLGVFAGFLCLSQIDGLWAFYASFCLVSAGINFCGTQSATTVASHWFRRRRSSALTLVTIGGALSGLTVPVLAWMVATAAGAPPSCGGQQACWPRVCLWPCS